MTIEVIQCLTSRIPQYIIDRNATLQNHNKSGNQDFLEYSIPEEICDTDIDYYECEYTTINVNAYERNVKARKACLDHYGFYCFVCGASLEKVYGSIAQSFIHVHHIIPLSRIKKGYLVNGVQDLRPVCPNCHAILHRQYMGKNISIEELQRLIRSENL